MKVVIIGANAAGMSCASRLKRKAPDTQVTVLERGAEVSYGSCGLPYYVAGLNNDIDLVRIRSAKEFAEQGIDLRLRAYATQINPSDKTVVYTDSDSVSHVLHYDKLLMATGAAAIVPAYAVTDAAGVYTLKTVEDALRLRKAIEDTNAQNIVIVGGGYIGLELAEACVLQKKASIRVIEAQDTLLGGFDPEFGESARKELANSGVLVHLSEPLCGFSQHNGRVCGVCTTKGEYPADVVILAVGVRPETSLLPTAQKLKNGALIVDGGLRTSEPDIYAAGDCAAALHRLLGTPVYMPLGTNANKQGRLAADSMMGLPVDFARCLGTAMIRCLNVEFAKTGISEVQATAAGLKARSITVQSKTHARYYPDPQPVTIKVCYEVSSKRLLGAQLMGGKNSAWRVDVFACAIDAGMTAPHLGFLDLGYAPPFASVWDAVQIAANAVK